MNNNNNFSYNNQPNMDGSVPGTSVVVKSEVTEVNSIFQPMQSFMGFSDIPEIQPSSSGIKFDVASVPIHAEKWQQEENLINGVSESNLNLAGKKYRRRRAKLERARIKRLARAQMNGDESIAIIANQNPEEAKRIQNVVAKLEQKKIMSRTPRTVFICAVYFRDIKLTNSFKESLQEVLDSELDNVPPGSALPKFENFDLTDGFIRVRCADEFSVKWIESAINKISTLHDIEIMTTERPGSCARRKIVAMVPGKPIDPQTVLARLQRFNPELNINGWKVMQSEVIEDEGLRIILNINEKLAKQLVGTKKQAGMVMVSFNDLAPDNFGPETIVNLRDESMNEPNLDVPVVTQEPDNC